MKEYVALNRFLEKYAAGEYSFDDEELEAVVPVLTKRLALAAKQAEWEDSQGELAQRKISAFYRVAELIHEGEDESSAIARAADECGLRKKSLARAYPPNPDRNVGLRIAVELAFAEDLNDNKPLLNHRIYADSA